MGNLSPGLHAFVFMLLAVTDTALCRHANANVRLVNPDEKVKHEGFVEIHSAGVWRKITNVRWDVRNDIVVCKQLGFTDVARKPYKLPKYPGMRRFILKHYFCQGAERTISDCDEVDIQHRKLRSYAKEGNEAWVSCSDKLYIGITEPRDSLLSRLVAEVELRLVNEETPDQEKPAKTGVLEVNIKGEWHQVCAEGWTEANSNVACGHLGYTHALESIPKVSYRKPKHHILKNVECNGTEGSLLSCDHAGLAKHFGCTDSVFLHCETVHLNKEELNVRLRGGQRPSEGRVEVFRSGTWGTVCHDDWDINDANVVCKQLGFGTAKKAVRWGEYGQGTLAVSMTNVNCKGTETSLTSCDYDAPANTCNHYKDAGVQCNYRKANFHKVRLAGGKNRYEGRVEVYHLGRWYSICGLQFSELDGEVVCRELGLGFLSKVLSTWEYGVKRIGIYEPGCSGNEATILSCHHRPWFQGTCRYYDMAVVKCNGYAPDILMDVNAMQSSIKINSWHLHHLSCSKSENCLTRTAYEGDAYVNPKKNYRRLMVFTSLILNKGTAAFRPNRHKDQWEWHQCHRHFHSMEYFAQYDVIDFHGRKVAEGHKASFCLEDSECEKGYKKMYNCTDKGDQGISVGCADNYANAIDCQWVDVTDVKEGNYTLMVHLNPSKLIIESDYSNNMASCEVHYYNSSVTVGECSAEPCEQRSYGGTGYGMCCHFPFMYNDIEYNSCISLDKDSRWCSTTYDFEADRKWGYCNPQL